MIKGGSKYISLERLKEIRENSYRTKCGKFEFCVEEIEDLINEKETNKMLNEIEQQLKKVV
jgi:hypothetical protein